MKHKRFSSWESQHGQNLFPQLRKQCVLWLGAMFVDLHVRHVYLRVMCQLVPTLSSVFYCWFCLLWPFKHLAVCVVFPAQHMIVIGGKCFIFVSTNNVLQLTTHPPQSSAHSPLSKKTNKLKATLSLFSSAPSYFLPFILSSLLPALFCFSVLPCSQQKINAEPFQLCMTLHTCCTNVCACLCTQGGKHETDV